MVVKIGNLFDSNAKTLVNTVNCVGVMGKGIAKEFKTKYPPMYDDYEQRCKNKKVEPGKPYLYTDQAGTSILNFPTKDHWRSPSKLSYIISGLDWFVNNYHELGVTSIAFPPLGCGNGGLKWEVVGPLMYSKLKDLPINIEIYAPYGTSAEKLTKEYLLSNVIQSPKEILGNKNIPFNKYWYLLLYVVQRLNHERYALNVGRTIFQKVCFVLTRTGVPTGFHFREGSYGPYSDEVKDAVTVLSNANLMTEKQFGSMIETVVSSDFVLQKDLFTKTDLDNTESAIDLLSRIKSTDQAEMIATVLFSYDELKEKNGEVTEAEMMDHILGWKKRWKGVKEAEIQRNIHALTLLGWMRPVLSQETMDVEDNLF